MERKFFSSEGEATNFVLDSMIIESKNDAESIEQEIKECEKKMATLLLLEHNAKVMLEKRRDELLIAKLACDYPIISQEIFKMRDKDGFPVFAAFNINHYEFQITENLWPNTPTELVNKYYKDVQKKLKQLHEREIINTINTNKGIKKFFGWQKKRNDEHVFLIKSVYEGTIPEQVRKRIQKLANERIFHNIYILSEAKWEVQKVSRTSICPLVIGSNYDEKFFFFIDKFDTTPLEEYVSREFV